jgi:hypothetical protein
MKAPKSGEEEENLLYEAMDRLHFFILYASPIFASFFVACELFQLQNEAKM